MRSRQSPVETDGTTTRSGPQRKQHPGVGKSGKGAGADCCALGSGTNSWEGRVHQHPDLLPHEMVPDPIFSRWRSFATRTDCTQREGVRGRANVFFIIGESPTFRGRRCLLANRCRGLELARSQRRRSTSVKHPNFNKTLALGFEELARRPRCETLRHLRSPNLAPASRRCPACDYSSPARCRSTVAGDVRPPCESLTRAIETLRFLPMTNVDG